MSSSRPRRSALPAKDQIRLWRVRQKLSQEQAAERVGVKQSTWSDWELGHKTPRTQHAITVQRVTRTPIEAWGTVP